MVQCSPSWPWAATLEETRKKMGICSNKVRPSCVHVATQRKALATFNALNTIILTINFIRIMYIIIFAYLHNIVRCVLYLHIISQSS